MSPDACTTKQLNPAHPAYGFTSPKYPDADHAGPHMGVPSRPGYLAFFGALNVPSKDPNMLNFSPYETKTIETQNLKP